MTLATTTPQIEYTMNGSTLAFDFAFKMWQATVNDEIDVVFQEGETDEATLSINTDYTLSAPNNNYDSGGTVTLSSDSSYITSGKTLLIKSSLPRSQTYDLQHGGELNTDSLETILDRMTRMIQEAETYSSISQTALDNSIKALFADILVDKDGSVLTHDGDVSTI
ncbi:hypothetical protein LCGC14_2373810 [marine sediment metagenome]|uniref:Uncharacterized protein n=1 Tax=marine sediment metagenome TaxID=412755 RepID=A0A0F9EFC4_9ZZZZ